MDDEQVEHWTRRVDWTGLSVFVFAAAVGVTVVTVAAAEVARGFDGEGSVLVNAMASVLGAMVGAVSTYMGLYRRTPAARHRREEEGS